MPRLFGTDGVRGIAGTELSCLMAFELGRASAYVLSNGTHRPRILVGRDPRISGQMLESALVAGICSVGAEAVLVGVLPTPAVAYLTRIYPVDAGIMITASHNPMEYNGIKFFNHEGFKLTDAVEDRIELLLNNHAELPHKTGSEVGFVTVMHRAQDDYLENLKTRLHHDLSGLKVVVDCANGSASSGAPQLLSELGIDVMSVCDHPNGRNINDHCGSTNMKRLQSIVRDTDADVGLAFDGDADRLLAVDEQGNIVDGDQIMAICARELLVQGKLANNTLVATVMSNMGLSITMENLGIQLEKTAVGDRYVLERMQECGHCIGGEQSGHIIFLEENTTGDGLLTALHLLEAMVRNKAKLSELASIMQVLPQVLINVHVSNDKKHDWEHDKTIVEAVKHVEKGYMGKGRVMVRTSGTEPLIRLVIEGRDEMTIRHDAEQLAHLIKDRLG